MSTNRRDFLKHAAWGLIGAAWIAQTSWVTKAFAAAFRTPAPADVAEPGKAGPALLQKYAHFASEFTGKRKPNFPANANCKNCSLFRTDKAGDAWGRCAMIGNKRVYEEGLCQAWLKKAGA